jgi:predicted nucleic acid-binding protein
LSLPFSGVIRAVSPAYGLLARSNSVFLSGDKHLLQVEEYMGIEITAPRAFVETFSAQT